MFTVAFTCIACFVAGMAVQRAYKDDPAVNEFADAACTVAGWPLILITSLVVKAKTAAATASVKQSPRPEIAKK